MGNPLRTAADMVGYNSKERAILYGGIITGALIPTIATRYVMFQDVNDTIEAEAFAWGISAISNLVNPLFYISTFAGFIAGTIGAANSQGKRLSKRNKLEDNLIDPTTTD